MADRPLRSIAVIPARGGSKRLPDKALIPFNGKPMIVHTIEAAIESECFDRIVVSSDRQKILDIAADAGADILKRETSLSGDAVPTAPVLLDVLERERSNGHKWDILACLYATAPLRTAADITAVIDLIEPGRCDFAMAVCGSDRPVHQALSIDDGILSPVWPDLIGRNTQDVPQYVFGNGSTYAVSVPAFLKSKSLYGPGIRGYRMPLWRSVDVDTAEDLELLEYYARRTNTS